jgi:hypothetical protein
MPSDDIILRVAQAILDVHRERDQPYLVSWDYLSAKQRAMYGAMARAALVAVVEPSAGVADEHDYRR